MRLVYTAVCDRRARMDPHPAPPSSSRQQLAAPPSSSVCHTQAGCTMEDTGAWVNLPQDDNLLVVGLKELALDTFPIVNKHTYFAHVFKGQEGWQVCVCVCWSDT